MNRSFLFLRPGLALIVAFAAGLGVGWALRSGNPVAAAAEKTAAGGDPGGGNRRAGTVASRVPELSGLSPRDARRLLDGMTDSRDRTAAIARVLATMPPEQWNAWIESRFAAGQRSPHKADMAGQARRYAMINDIHAAIVTVDPAGYMAAQHSRGERNTDGESQARLLVMMKWAEISPAAAKAFLESRLTEDDPAPGYSDAVRFVASVLTQNGDPGVLDWVASLPEKHRGEGVAAAFSELSVREPAAAAEKLGAFLNLPGFKADRAAEEIGASWAQADPRSAFAWAAGRTGAMPDSAMAGVLSTWATRDFEAALTAVKALPEGAAGAAWPALARRTPAERLPELAGLLEQLPADASRAKATDHIMSEWTHRDPEAASRWMQRQPPGEVLDSAVTRFVRWADVRDPEAALLWAGSMSDAAKRMEALEHIIGQLGDKAPATVQPWLESNRTLTEAERAQLTGKLGPAR